MKKPYFKFSSQEVPRKTCCQPIPEEKKLKPHKSSPGSFKFIIFKRLLLQYYIILLLMLSYYQRYCEMDSRRVPVADMFVLDVHNDVSIHIADVPGH